MTSKHEQRLEKASGPSRRLLALLVGLLASLALIASGAAAASAPNAVGPQPSGLILAAGSQTLAAQTSIGADGLAQLRQASATGVAADTAGDVASNLPKLGVKPNFTNPAESPGTGWEWRGTGEPGTSKGSWYNPNSGESLHPDLGHPDPIGPHYDWKAPDGTTYRVYPDGTVVPK